MVAIRARARVNGCLLQLAKRTADARKEETRRAIASFTVHIRGMTQRAPRDDGRVCDEFPFPPLRFLRSPSSSSVRVAARDRGYAIGSCDLSERKPIGPTRRVGQSDHNYTSKTEEESLERSNGGDGIPLSTSLSVFLSSSRGGRRAFPSNSCRL